MPDPTTPADTLAAMRDTARIIVRRAKLQQYSDAELIAELERRGY